MSHRDPRRGKRFLAAALLGSLLISCAQPTPYPTPTPYPEVIILTPTPEIVLTPGGPAAYIEDFVVYKQGLGIVAYFVLADEMGIETIGAGEATLTISSLPIKVHLYSMTFSVTPEDFEYIKVGKGQLERTRLLYSFGWIGYDDFQTQRLGEEGRATLVFHTSDGQAFSVSTGIAW